MGEKSKFYLALDLGIASIGWAVMKENQGNYNIDDFGVRIFETAESNQDGETNAAKRRSFRSAKRLNRRRKQRISDLKKFLEANGIVSQNEIINFYQTHKVVNKIDYDNNMFFNPYVLRAKALTHKISKAELAIILLNIINSRGYNDKFSLQKEKDNKKEGNNFNNSISQADALVKKYGTIAQAIVQDEVFKDKNNHQNLGIIHNKKSSYRFLFARDDYRHELKLILNYQQQFFPQLTNEKINFLIEEIILRQRDFEDGPGPKNEAIKNAWLKNVPKHHLYKSFLQSEGNCGFYCDQPRGYRSSVTFDLFQMVSSLSTFTSGVINDPEEIKKIANAILAEIKNGNVPNKNMLKDIMIKNSSSVDKSSFKDNPAWNNKNMKIEFKYLKFLASILPEQFATIDINNLSNHFFNKLGEILHNNITPVRKKEAILDFLHKNNLILSEEKINLFLPTNNVFSAATASCSFKYMEEAILNFFAGGNYGVFQNEFNQKHESEKFNYIFKNKKIFQPIQDVNLMKNTIVYRAVNQARKVIIALHKKYQCFFDVINVEVSRELTKSFSERKAIERKNEINNKKRIEVKEKLFENNIKINDENIKKYVLWEGQNKKCFYCENHHEINLEEFNHSAALQLDHIIPQSVFSDDTLDNLVLVCDRSNQQKGKRTPLQWMANNIEQKKSFLAFTKQLKFSRKISDKKYDYLLTEDIDDEKLKGFKTRNLNDNSYISKYVANWLRSEFKNWNNLTNGESHTLVQMIRGAVTSKFRRVWLRDSAWGLDKKVRDITHYHHAVDAIILTQFISYTYVTFASDIASINSFKRLKIIDEKDYLNRCEEVIAKWKSNKFYLPNAVEKLQSLMYKKDTFKVMPPLIKDLKDFVENHIPVILDIEIKKEINEKGFENKYSLPKFVKVLNQEEYYEKLEKIHSEFCYPFISYKMNYKLLGALTKENPIKNSSKVYEEDKKGNYIMKDIYSKDKNNNIWDTSNYYGVAVKSNELKLESQWIKFFGLNKQKIIELKKDYQILVHNSIVEYYDQKQQKKVMKVFAGKNGASINAYLLGTSYITNRELNKNLFFNQNYYDSISNWKKDFKILQPNILGKIVKK